MSPVVPVLFRVAVVALLLTMAWLTLPIPAMALRVSVGALMAVMPVIGSVYWVMAAVAPVALMVRLVGVDWLPMRLMATGPVWLRLIRPLLSAFRIIGPDVLPSAV